MAVSTKGLVFFLVLLQRTCGFPEQGRWSLSADNDSPYIGITKSMFNQTEIRVKVKCDSQLDSSASDNVNITIAWVLRKTPCWKEYLVYSQENERFYESLFQSPERPLQRHGSENFYWPSILKPDPINVKCDHTIILPSVDGKEMLHVQGKEENGGEQPEGAEPTEGAGPVEGREVMGGVRVRRQAKETRSLAVPAPGAGATARTNRPLVAVNSDGVYLFMMHITPANNASFRAVIDVDMVSSYGYLSASDYPLLVFYSILCVVYVLYGVVWLVLCFIRWRDLLRLQYWIAAVIFIGLVEKAVYVAEYESLNERGYSVPGLLIAAELVSCAKRTIARILVVIVALGFGIVKPRLGSLLHRVIVLGLLYFVLASIESCTRALQPKTDPSKQYLLAIVLLALLDSLVCWWVFSALVATSRTLRLRRNTTKLALYSHFTNVLAAAVVSSVLFMIWSIRYHQYEECLQDWKELWVDDAFWHLLFALLLFAIMVLWRPTNNNQRFAFSPLLDEGSDDEDCETLMGPLAADTKHRGRANSNASSSPRSQHNPEDDLKWVEENIPSSLADTNLSVLDSDEEILTTRFEISKMQ